MTIKRKPLKPVKGWVVVGPDGDMADASVFTSRTWAWSYFCPDEDRKALQRDGYRAVPVVVMERGKSR